MDSLLLMAEMIGEMEVETDAMTAAASDEMLLATDIADYLVHKGVPFRESHEIVGGLTAWSMNEKQPFSAIPLERLREFSGAFEEDIAEVLSVAGALEARRSVGAPSPENLKAQIERWRGQLEEKS